jgi:putative hemolysin
VGTYRLQTGGGAAAHLGYYSEQEFDFGPFEPHRGEVIELGRACVDRHHRNLVVLGLLWQGIGRYAQSHGGRYLLGCSSLTSQDPAVGAAAFREFRDRHAAPPEWRTVPRPEFACALESPAAAAPPVPKLLRAYLSLGARICAPPAIDREFKTIDFLTWLDLEGLPSAVRSRFLG